MAKAKDAFRTISEVAAWLDTPTHVLRFWESKFSQIKPVKGAGGRRYYRPTDMDLLGGIKKLLHEDGMSIKGTQKLLREKGVKHIATLGQSMTTTSDEPGPVAQPIPAAPKRIAADSKPDLSLVAPVQDALPFDTPTLTHPDFTITLPAPPAHFPKIAPRLIGRAPVQAATLKGKVTKIAPLLERLEALSARMRE